MKTIMMLLWLLVVVSLHAQKIDSSAVSKLTDDQREEVNRYLNKAAQNRSSALATSIVAGGLVFSGVISGLIQIGHDLDFTSTHHSNYTASGVLLFSGLFLGLCSIPQWRAIHHNRNKARAILYAAPPAGTGSRFVMPHSQQVGIKLLVPIGR